MASINLTGNNEDSNLNIECKFCRSLISENAKKCKECGSYQKWYQIIFSGAMQLSALILALLSILVIMGPKIDRFWNKEPKTQFSFLFYEYSPFVIKVICSNSGYSNAILKKAEINLGENVTKELSWGSTSPIIKAKSSNLFAFKIIFRANYEKLDYPFDNIKEDLRGEDNPPSLKIIVIHSGNLKEIIHKLYLPRP